MGESFHVIPLGTKQLSKMTVFNDQAHIQIGGQWNDNLRRVERPFRGILAGVTFNGLRPLDLAGAGDLRIKINGDVQKLNNIPFDYREKHPELFTKDAIRLMIDQIYKDKNHGVTPDLSKYIPMHQLYYCFAYNFPAKINISRPVQVSVSTFLYLYTYFFRRVS